MLVSCIRHFDTGTLMFNLDAADDFSSEQIDDALYEHIDTIIEKFLQGVTTGKIVIDGVDFDYTIEINGQTADLIFHL